VKNKIKYYVPVCILYTLYNVHWLLGIIYNNNIAYENI